MCVGIGLWVFGQLAVLTKRIINAMRYVTVVEFIKFTNITIHTHDTII